MIRRRWIGLVDDLVPHGVHDKTGNGLGAYFCFHVLADGFDGACAKEDFFGNLFGGFIFSQQLKIRISFRKI